MSETSILTPAEYESVAERYLAAWNEPDASARATALADVCSPDVRYTDPLADVSGLAGLSAAIGSVQQQFPGFGFVAFGPVDGHHGQARFGWELGPQSGPAPIAGFDVVELDARGRITRVLGFLDRVPTA